MTGQWFSPDPPVSFTNKTNHHDITEILLKVALNTINLNRNIHYLFDLVVCLHITQGNPLTVKKKIHMGFQYPHLAVSLVSNELFRYNAILFHVFFYNLCFVNLTYDVNCLLYILS